MKALFNICVVILLLVDAFALAGCAGVAPQTAPPANTDYTIDVCEHTFTAVDRFASPSCAAGYVSSSRVETFEGTPVTSMWEGRKVYGVVPHDAAVGASVCIHVECKEVGR